MNVVDVALAVVLIGCALRGWWRGFFRECCGLLALVGGLASALACTAHAEAVLESHVRLPPPLGAGVTFVAIFVAVHAIVNVVGVVLSRRRQAGAASVANALGGAVFGAATAATVLAFILLFLHLFPIMSKLGPQIMDATLGRPLMNMASNVIRLGAQPNSPSRT